MRLMLAAMVRRFGTGSDQLTIFVELHEPNSGKVRKNADGIALALFA